jgi:hypothetical protein
MENKLIRFVPRRRIMEAIQWNDPEHPPKGVTVYKAQSDPVKGYYYDKSSIAHIVQPVYVGDWLFYTHDSGTDYRMFHLTNSQFNIENIENEVFREKYLIVD